MNMASSGFFSTNNYFDSTNYVRRNLKLTWWTISQSVVENKTVIGWELRGGGDHKGYRYYTQNIRVIIDNVEVYNLPRSEGTILLDLDTLVSSGEFEITHSNDGSRTFSVYAEAGIYTWAVNCSGSGLFTLDTIPRASTFEQLQNGILGQEQTITIDRKSSLFSHTLTWKTNSYSGIICDKSTELTLHFNPAMDLANDSPYGVSVHVEFTLKTYNGDVLIGSPVVASIDMSIPDDVVPSCDFQLSDQTGYFEKFGGYIQRQSKLEVHVSSIPAYGSPIDLISSSVDGNTYDTSDFVTPSIKTSGLVDISARVSDGRSRYGYSNHTITVLPYSEPEILLLKVNRCNEDGSTNEGGLWCKVTYSISITELSGLNSKTAKILYKRSGEATYSEIPFDIGYHDENKSIIFKPDSDGGFSYEIVLRIADDFAPAEKAVPLSTAFTIMHFRNTGRGMAIGKVSEKDAFEVGMDAEFVKGLASKYFASMGGETKVFVVPPKWYNDFGVAPSSYADFYREWVSWICREYPAQNRSIFIGMTGTGNTCFAVTMIYDTSDVNEEGVPRYCGGMQIPATPYDPIGKFGTGQFQMTFVNIG